MTNAIATYPISVGLGIEILEASAEHVVWKWSSETKTRRSAVKEISGAGPCFRCGSQWIALSECMRTA